DVASDAGAVVRNLDGHLRLTDSRAQRQRAACAHGPDGVVDEVGPYLRQLTRIALYRRQIRGVVPRDDDPCDVEPVLEDQQGVLEAGMHVDVGDGSPVEVGVVLDGPYQ